MRIAMGILSLGAMMMAELLNPIGALGGDAEAWPMPDWSTTAPAGAGMEGRLLEQARDYALKGGGSGCITRHGRIVLSWGDPKAKYDLKSTTKSFGATAVALAVADGKIALDDLASKHHPQIAKAAALQPGWGEKITIFHLLTQTAGFDKPGGYSRLLFEPGGKWLYSDCGPNWLAECVTLAYRRDVSELMFERVFTPLGIKPADLTWRDNWYRPKEIDGIVRREFGAGISANVDAMARLGLLYLRGGRWSVGGRDKQIIPNEFVELARTTPPANKRLPTAGSIGETHAANHYGLLWWNNNDRTLRNVPADAYWAWGLGDSFIFVIPSLDVVVARAGQAWPDVPGGQYARIAPILEPIVRACGQAATTSSPGVMGEARSAAAKPPYPPSPVIKQIVWADAKTIVRQADDCDNWPITWADDGHQYAAYGDGRGFAPKVERKLSLGLCRIEGAPADFRGVNIRSGTGEQVGDGPAGKKASGLLCVDGVLYMFVRNAKNSQLAWSRDHGTTWTWADWRFTTSFGCPTLLNFGKDYGGARDDFVYVCSFDSDTAYKPADRMVLARVAKDRLRQRQAYEFFARLDEKGRPVWSKDINDRGAVFEHKGCCYRSGISYNAALKRYLWVQLIPGGDTRFKGGLGIYDAPEPWGPWTTAFFAEQWDVGPGESASFPTKWMSPNGRTLHLVFSGDDHFSVRKATLDLSGSAEKDRAE